MLSFVARWAETVNHLHTTLYPDLCTLTQPHLFLWLAVKRLNGLSPDKKNFGVQPKSLSGRMADTFAWLEQRIPDDEILSLPAVTSADIPHLETLFQTFLDQDLRTSSGSYYTPERLASFMVRESLRSHYRAHMGEASGDHFPLDAGFARERMPVSQARKHLEWFYALNLLDLSCGSGVFLRQGLRTLVALGQRIHSLCGSQIAQESLVRHVAENQLTGVDVQPETLYLAELLLRLELTQLLPQKPVDPGIAQEIRLQLHCANGLTWEPAPDRWGEKTFFRMILGNPPYVGEKGNTDLFREVKETPIGRLHYEKNMDFAYFFLHRGLDLLSPDGVLCYVTTSYFATADGAAKLRRRLQEQTAFHWLVYPERVTLFPQAKGQHNLIYCLGKRNGYPGIRPVMLHVTEALNREDFLYRLLETGFSGPATGGTITRFPAPNDLFDQRGQLIIRSREKNRRLLERMDTAVRYQLQDLCFVNQGLVSGADKMTAKHEELLGFQGAGRGIFVLNGAEKNQLLTKEPGTEAFLKPFYKNSGVWPYRVATHTDQWLLYLTDAAPADIGQFPALKQHLIPFRPLLEKRREVQKGMRRWHSLHWPRDPAIFEKEKIVAPQRAGLNVFALAPGSWYASADVYFLHRRDTCFFHLEYLLSWLNSALCYAWLSHYGKRKGKDLELYATPLKRIPVPEPPDGEQEQWLVKKVHEIINVQNDPDKAHSIQRAMDERFLDWLRIDRKEAADLLDQVVLLREGFNRRGI